MCVEGRFASGQKSLPNTREIVIFGWEPARVKRDLLPSKSHQESQDRVTSSSCVAI